MVKCATLQHVACVASVSVRFRRKERGTRVKDRKKSGSRFISRAAQTENPVPRGFFAPKLNGNAYYAGYPTRHEIKISNTNPCDNPLKKYERVLQ